MKIKGLITEDFMQYKKPSLFVITSFCDYKCERDCGISGICQNSPLAKAEILDIPNSAIIRAYTENEITKAITFGGLEPLDQFKELIFLISEIRKYTDDTIIIYTGYYPEEIHDELAVLKQFRNIIVKFGRFIPNSKNRFDEVLGVILASENQWAEQIS